MAQQQDKHTWQRFVKQYAQANGLTYANALSSAGAEWENYKQKNQIVNKYPPRPKITSEERKAKKEIAKEKKKAIEIGKKVLEKKKISKIEDNKEQRAKQAVKRSAKYRKEFVDEDGELKQVVTKSKKPKKIVEVSSDSSEEEIIVRRKKAPVIKNKTVIHKQRKPTKIIEVSASDNSDDDYSYE